MEVFSDSFFPHRTLNREQQGLHLEDRGYLQNDRHQPTGSSQMSMASMVTAVARINVMKAVGAF